MVLHALKTIQPFFDNVKNGIKTFEIRKRDRSFHIDDILILQEYDPTNNTYTGSLICVQITDILYDKPEYGLMPGYCIISFKNIGSDIKKK